MFTTAGVEDVPNFEIFMGIFDVDWKKGMGEAPEGKRKIACTLRAVGYGK